MGNISKAFQVHFLSTLNAGHIAAANDFLIYEIQFPGLSESARHKYILAIYAFSQPGTQATTLAPTTSPTSFSSHGQSHLALISNPPLSVQPYTITNPSSESVSVNHTSPSGPRIGHGEIAFAHPPDVGVCSIYDGI